MRVVRPKLPCPKWNLWCALLERLDKVCHAHMLLFVSKYKYHADGAGNIVSTTGIQQLLRQDKVIKVLAAAAEAACRRCVHCAGVVNFWKGGQTLTVCRACT